MTKCEVCGTEMKMLLTSMYCPNNCDKEGIHLGKQYILNSNSRKIDSVGIARIKEEMKVHWKNYYSHYPKSVEEESWDKYWDL